MRRWSATVLVAFVFGIAAAGSAPPAGGVGVATLSPPAGALVAPGAAPDLFLLFTGDVIGYVEPCG